MRHCFLLATLLFSTVNFSQTDFDNFRTLQSYGEIPEDFVVPTYLKVFSEIENDRSEIEKFRDEFYFVQHSRYAIDEILQSGLIIYGDPISEYTKAVAHQLLKSNDELKQSLRFYTLKSDDPNAFSTDQGIIVVTTGLLSILNNEAELAYILAHEIAHYTEKHVIKSFVVQKDTKKDQNWIKNLSKYSRANELEADTKAVELYKEAGYAVEYIISAMDVLTRTHLPFEEVVINLDYFQTSQLQFSDSLFPQASFPILIDDNDNDSLSTHPNILKRKQAISAKIDGLNGKWGSASRILSQSHFEELKKIAQFESLRIQVVKSEYGNALYSIFLLEQDFPKSIFLKRMKAQCWLGLYQFSKTNLLEGCIKDEIDFQGESAKIHFFIRQLGQQGVNAAALRTVYDLKTELPDDKEVEAIYRFLIQEISSDEGTSLYPCTGLSDTIQAINSIDTTRAVPIQNVTTNNTNPYCEGIMDILSDTNFIARYQEAKLQPKPEEYHGPRSKREIKEDYFVGINLGMSEFIILEPTVISHSKKGINNIKGEQLEKTFSEALQKSSNAAGTKIKIVDDEFIINDKTAGFNYKCILKSTLFQISGNDSVQVFPVEYSSLLELTNTEGITNIMLAMVDHTRVINKKLKYWLITSSLGIFPMGAILPILIPYALITANKTNIHFIVINALTGKVECQYNDSQSVQLNRRNLSGYFYQIFMELQSEPNQ